jgi:hypothetical protein
VTGTQEPDSRRVPGYNVGDRVLVHDPDPPFRLWEGRVTNAAEPRYEITILGRIGGELVTAESKLVHPVPIKWPLDCPFCRGE